jgi:prolipoprotein diacylglyceryl transferase
MPYTLIFINWDPSPDFIHIGMFAIKWYGVMWGLSLFSCFFLAQYVFRKVGKDEEKITLAIQYIFIGGLTGARLAHILFYSLDYYMAHPEDIIAVWKGGLASHGGVVGGLVGLYAFCIRNKEFGFFWLLDHGIICVIALAALIRFGNLMNSELYGKPTDVPWAFIFRQVDNVPRHPVVLYESIAYLFIQLIMLYAFNKYKESKPGIYLVIFLVLVFSVRFILEFYKEPDGALIAGVISKTQALNLPFIMAGLIIGYYVLKGKLQYTPVSNG